MFRTSGTWPQTKVLYCYPVPLIEWPDDPGIVEQPVRSCVRRGAAIDLVLDRSRENRSQIVFTTARGRDAVFLAISAHSQAGPPECAHPHCASSRDRRATDRGSILTSSTPTDSPINSCRPCARAALW